jgi:hypothetical protein
MGNISLTFKRTYFPPEFDGGSPQTVESGESVELLINEGQAPFNCQNVGGGGTGFTVKSTETGCRVTAGQNISGYIKVQATDNQGNTTGTWSVGGVDCTSCTEITWDDITSGTSVAQNDSTTIAINGGACGYYDWSVSGTGFSLEHTRTYGTTNTLHANGSACGAAEVTVTDACGNEVIHEVKCTSGTWLTCTPTSNLTYTRSYVYTCMIARSATSPDGLYKYGYAYSGSLYCGGCGGQNAGNNPAYSCEDGSTAYLSYCHPPFAQVSGRCETGRYYNSGFSGANPGLQKWGCPQ